MGDEATGGEGVRHGPEDDASARLTMVFGQSDSAVFPPGWDVLLGQREAQNWLRSEPGRNEVMRYPAEWNFAGGAVELGEEPAQAARRELEEEFQIEIPRSSMEYKFHLVSVKQTRAVRNVSNIMYNFVAAAEENPWLQNLDTTVVNSKLERRRATHEAAVEDGSFWKMDVAEREQVSPEIRQVQWLDMRSAVLNAFTSMNRTFIPVNAFQAEEFSRLNIHHRDPMFITMVALLELHSFPSLRSLIRHSASLDPQAELLRVQWLWEGMSPEEVMAIMRAADQEKKGKNHRDSMFWTAEEREAVHGRRQQEDEDEARVIHLPHSRL